MGQIDLADYNEWWSSFAVFVVYPNKLAEFIIVGDKGIEQSYV